MRLIFTIGRALTLVAAVGLSFAAIGCGGAETDSTDTSTAPAATTPETSPVTDLGSSEAGSATGKGADVPEAGDKSSED